MKTKINYQFKTESPMHTGHSSTLGNIRQFRREQIFSANEYSIKTRFREGEDNLKRDAMMLIYFHIWQSIETNMKSSVSIWEQFTSKTLAASYGGSKMTWLNNICQSFSIKSVAEKESNRLSLYELFDLFADSEFLDLIRIEYLLLASKFRKFKDEQMNYQSLDSIEKSFVEIEGKNGTELAQFKNGETSPLVKIEQNIMPVFERSFEEKTIKRRVEFVPKISGNSIRGILRRLIFDDYTKRVGVNLDRFRSNNEDILKMTSSEYNILFGGGTLSGSNHFEDIDERENLINLCPMLGLFGAAIGSRIMSGKLLVSNATIKCLERGNSDVSYHDMLSIDFGIRLDSLKSHDVDMKLTGKEDSSQMIFFNEVINPGVIFDHEFGLKSDDKLMLDCFHHLMNLYLKGVSFGGKTSIGYGEISIEGIEENIKASERYYAHIDSKCAEIIKFFGQEEDKEAKKDKKAKQKAKEQEVIEAA